MRSVLALTALVASVAAQATQNLTAALTSDPDLSNLTAIVSTFPQLVTALGSATNITILAPSNAAFAKFLNNSGANATLGNTDLVQAILSYHILNGTINSTQITSNATFVPTHLNSPLLANVTGGQRVEALNNSGTVQIISGLLATSNVTKADIAYNNGIIHVIDAILTPPANISDTAVELNLTAVAGALEEADLVDVVDGARDLTVFAPYNDAFKNIGSLVANASSDLIASVLAYHVVNGSVLYSTDIKNGSLDTFGGGKLTVTVANGSVFVNQAKVIIPNVLVANGVVHVIDSVLNPNNTSIAPGTNGTAFGNATTASGVPFTSAAPSPTGSATIPSVVASATSSSTAGAAAFLPTGAIGAGMMFAGALMAL